ncbi:MAG: hypothetical protein BWY78_00522 [Alphaproteobacteria bacterium ADurb.Bin438]|nr:MAG: hypothetical protein BWY78_00522 [Alphaproteobacteria bacterium ADurb.Bin438]
MIKEPLKQSNKQVDVNVNRLAVSKQEKADILKFLIAQNDLSIVKNKNVSCANQFEKIDTYAFVNEDGQRCVVACADTKGKMSTKEGKDISLMDFKAKDGDEFSGRVAVVKSGDLNMVVSLLTPKCDESLSYVDVKAQGKSIDGAFYHYGKKAVPDIFLDLEKCKRGKGLGCSFEGPALDMYKYLLRQDEVNEINKIRENGGKDSLSQKTKLDIQKALRAFGNCR